MLVLVVFYVVFGLLVTIFQERIIYQPNSQNFQSCVDLSSAEKIDHAGTRMYLKNVGPKIIVFYHGNAGSACDRAFIAEIFERHGYSYLIPEYTGYSNDSRIPSHDLLKRDVNNVINFLQERDYLEVVLAGESIGTGFTAYHASLVTPKKLLLITPFSSLLDVAKYRLWFYPVSLMLKNAFINTDLLKDFNGPVLIIHGDKDKIIPLKFGQKLFNSLQSQHKTMLVIESAGHNDLFESPETYEAISSFIQ